ncbi:MAG: sacsin N-terminal ATP-binding-like domain-containing protein [Bacteroidales bacterium]
MNEIGSISDFQKSVSALITRNIDTYKVNPDRIISDYRGEKEFTEAYIGRQLLELLQNADDAKTENVLISIDTLNSKLSVANNGLPFDLSGVKSLMLAYTSSKNKKEFIGNKGLGFRSILNWVTWVKVKTKNVVLEFSPDIAKREFEKLVTDIDERQKLIDNEENLGEGEVPFAILSIPDFYENKEEQEWETIIEVKYNKQSEPYILKQIELITPEVLLFLNHITKIEINGTTNYDNVFIKERYVKGEDVFLSVNGIEWQLLDSGDISMPKNPKKFYRYKIAWQENLCDLDSHFFSYFRTEVPTHLPYLIHATFDLDPSRKYLNNTNDNKYLLSEIAQAIAYLASVKIKKAGKVDWKPVQFLSIEGKSAYTLLIPFFLEISKIKDTLEIYPCVDGIYRRKEEVKFYGNEFSEWVIRNKVTEHFPYLLLPLIQGLSLSKWLFLAKYTPREWLSFFEMVSGKIDDLEARVDLIMLLITDDFSEIHDKVHLPLLLDDAKNVVDRNTLVSTRKNGSTNEYLIPAYVKISFIYPDLLDLLVKKLSTRISAIRIPNESETRPLKKLLSPIVNIGSNDITDVVRIMTSAINFQIREGSDTIDNLLKPYIRSLFEIFKRNSDRKGVLDENIPIQLLNRNGNLARSNEVFLGREFQPGVITELLFDGIYNDESYIKGNEYWDLNTENASSELLENFFLWLGVNKFSKFKNIKKNLGRYENDDYTTFVFDSVGWPDFEPYKNYEVLTLSNFDEIIKSQFFTIEKLVAWIIKDRKLFSLLDDNNDDNGFNYTYNGIVTHLSEKPSYFKYQILKENLFSKVVLDFDFADQLGLSSVNLENDLFKTLKIEPIHLTYVLKNLGVKLSFNDLDAKVVYSLINTCGEKKSDPVYARKLYQLAFNNFQVSQTKNFEAYKKDFQILATNNGAKDYRSLDEVYYSDNSTLPSKIVEQFWIFDFPKRRGEKQISDYFGVKTFKDIVIEICDDTILIHPEENILRAWIDKIKPFILTYRLNSLTKDKSGKTVSGILKGLSIRLVYGLKYQVNGGGIKELLPSEFLNDKHTFYLCADTESKLEQLKDTPAFCEAIAEILCVLFEVNENKDDYRTIFKDKPELKDTQYLIGVKSLKEKYEEASRLLGLTLKEQEFWKNLFKKNEHIFPESISNLEELRPIVLLKLNFRLPDYYSRVNFDTYENQESVDFIKEICSHWGLSLSQIKVFHPGFPGLMAWHLSRFNQSTHDVEPLWNKACWLFFSQKEESEQRFFESKRKLFNQKIHSIVMTLSEMNSYAMDVCYEDSLINAISIELGVVIEKDQLADVLIENHYQEILKEYDLVITDLPEDIQSLIYFEGHDDLLKEELPKIMEKESTDTDKEVLPLEIESTLLITTSLNLGHIPISKGNVSGGHKQGGVHTIKSDRQKKKAGKRAEKLVRDKLTAVFPDGEVCWISGNSEDSTIKPDDSKGYDIIYKKNKIDQDWYYLEVKSISSDSFIISSNEVNVGIKEKERYHIALVEGVKIFLVEDFFLNDERVAEFNALRNCSSIRPIDYEVFFKLPEISLI